MIQQLLNNIFSDYIFNEDPNRLYYQVTPDGFVFKKKNYTIKKKQWKKLLSCQNKTRTILSSDL